MTTSGKWVAPRATKLPASSFLEQVPKHYTVSGSGVKSAISENGALFCVPGVLQRRESCVGVRNRPFTLLKPVSTWPSRWQLIPSKVPRLCCCPFSPSLIGQTATGQMLSGTYRLSSPPASWQSVPPTKDWQGVRACRRSRKRLEPSVLHHE